MYLIWKVSSVAKWSQKGHDTTFTLYHSLLKKAILHYIAMDKTLHTTICLFLKGVVQGKSSAMHLFYLNSITAWSHLQNEVDYVSELPLDSKIPTVKVERLKKTSVLVAHGLKSL